MEVFDYIIVGAGTAGCVLASRLVASGRRRVLLLEAGGSDRRLWIRVPIGYGRTFSDPRVNWMYATEPEPALLGRRVFWPRGKVLGGSGSINGMVYVRGLPHDFDDWQALGNPGWGYREVLPYFRRLEDYPGRRTSTTRAAARSPSLMCQGQRIRCVAPSSTAACASATRSLQISTVRAPRA